MTAYSDNMAKIQALRKQMSREWLYSTEPNPEYFKDSTYAMNFVSVSAGFMFDEEFDDRLEALMKEVTDDPNS